jgi:hypothetical protein
MLAASTIATYERMWDSQFTDIGFNNRLWLVPGCGERRNSFPRRIPENEKVCLRKDLQKLLSHISQSREIDITEGARKMYHEWYMNIPKSVHSKRLDTYAMRLMGLLTINELKPFIDEEIVTKVITLCDWQFQARRQYDPIDADTAMAKMEEKIKIGENYKFQILEIRPDEHKMSLKIVE